MRKRLAILFVVGLVSLNVALWLAQGVFALPTNLGSYFFGPRMVRAEVIVRVNGVNHDYRVDRGKIRAVSASSLTLRERDQMVVTLSVAPNVEVKLNGVPTSISALRPRMTATAVHEGAGPVTTIVATRR